jgi:hypothetical protein
MYQELLRISGSSFDLTSENLKHEDDDKSPVDCPDVVEVHPTIHIDKINKNVMKMIGENLITIRIYKMKEFNPYV